MNAAIVKGGTVRIQLMSPGVYGLMGTKRLTAVNGTKICLEADPGLVVSVGLVVLLVC